MVLVLVISSCPRASRTMPQPGPLFGVSSSTVCRTIQRLGPQLALEPVSRPADAAERLWIVDGTLVPVRDSTVGSSSRNYRFPVNGQDQDQAVATPATPATPAGPVVSGEQPRSRTPNPARMPPCVMHSVLTVPVPGGAGVAAAPCHRGVSCG